MTKEKNVRFKEMKGQPALRLPVMTKEKLVRAVRALVEYFIAKGAGLYVQRILLANVSTRAWADRKLILEVMAG